MVSLDGRLAPGEVAVLLHGAIPNANGTPVVDRWAVAVRMPDDTVQIQEVPHFLSRTRLAENTPSRPVDDLTQARAAIPVAVDRFQSHLVKLRREREAEVQRDLDVVLDRLAALETRFKAQLSLDLGDAPQTVDGLSPSEKRRLVLRQAKEQKIERLFRDWTEWFERTRSMVDDPNPYVDVKAVFVG